MKYKNIAEIDKNFALQNLVKDDLKIFDLPCEPFDIYGVFYDKKEGRFLRLPHNEACKISRGTVFLNNYTAGGRIRFATDSRRMLIKASYDKFGPMCHMPLLATSGFTLLREGEKETELVASSMPFYKDSSGFSSEKIIANDSELNYYTLYFPLYGDVKDLRLGFEKSAVVFPGKKYIAKKPILYYGSSITQGGCASRPDNCYQNFIEKWTNTDYINLGFSGCCKAEEEMAKYLSTISCSLFVCDYDYNAPDPDYLKKTHYTLYKIFRSKQKNTPILFLSMPTPWQNCAKEREKIIKATFLRAQTEGDKNVYFVRGENLFGKKDSFSCTVDGTHPNDLGFYRMAKCLLKYIKNIIFNKEEQK